MARNPVTNPMTTPPNVNHGEEPSHRSTQSPTTRQNTTGPEKVATCFTIRDWTLVESSAI